MAGFARARHTADGCQYCRSDRPSSKKRLVPPRRRLLTHSTVFAFVMLESERNSSVPQEEEGIGQPTTPRAEERSRWRSWGTWKAWGRLLRFRLRGRAPERVIAGLLVALIFAGSLWLIARELHGFEYAEVWAYLSDLPLSYVLLALGLTAGTFVVLAGYDALALRYVGVELNTRRIALSAFVGYAVSQAIGNPILTGGSVRYRLYSLGGLSPVEIGKAILFAGASFWLGFFTLGGIVFTFAPIGLADAFELPIYPAVLGGVCLIPIAAYGSVVVFREEPLTVWGWTLEVPSLWMLPIQVGLAMGDLLLASSVVFVLLPPEIGISLPHLVAVYLTALLAGLVSHVPGGLGVFESVALLLLTPTLPPPIILGSLLAYRGIFHILPLIVAMLAFGLFELWQGVDQLSDDPLGTSRNVE
jgi:uncharacterized membrane protein YbhN (UPF0104 family)